MWPDQATGSAYLFAITKSYVCQPACRLNGIPPSQEPLSPGQLNHIRPTLVFADA